MTRDELAALVDWILTNPRAKDLGHRQAADTIMLAVDNHVDYMVGVACDELREGVRGLEGVSRA